MRHLSVVEYGQFLACKGERLQVKEGEKVILETPLSRLRTICVAKEGVSLSSNVVMACANRGIHLFFQDWRGVSVAAISGKHQHAVVAIRQAQHNFIASPRVRDLCAELVITKVRNQRAVLLYFSKYLKEQAPDRAHFLTEAAISLKRNCEDIKALRLTRLEQWREQLLGYEGAAASLYWSTLRSAGLSHDNFESRHGRGALDVFNQSLNYGYTLLTSYIWSALDNAGFELYAGFLHTQKPGKASLVLDVMEEYRPWVVDRTVITLRKHLEKESQLTPKLKKLISQDIHKCMSKFYPYKGKRVKLANILQRQSYRLAGLMIAEKRYRGYRFKW